MIKKRKTAALFEVIARQPGEEQVRVPSWFRRARAVAAVPASRTAVRLKQPPGLAGQAGSATAIEAEVDEEILRPAAPAPAPRPASVPVAPAGQPLRRVVAPAAPATDVAASKPAVFPGVQTTVIPGAVARPAPAVAAPAPAPAVRPREESRPAADRVAGVVANRLRLSLSYPILIAVVLGLVVLLFAAYKLGQRPAAPPAQPAVEASPNPIAPPANVDGFDFNKAQAVGEARYNAEKRFIIVESNVASVADATVICEWLYKNGFVPETMNDSDTKAIVVIAMLKEPGGTAATYNKQAANIRELGKSSRWKLRDRYHFAEAQTVEKRSR